MSDKFELNAETRTTIGGGVNALRRAGNIPAIVYGHNVKPVAVQLKERELAAVLRKVGRNSLISLNLNGTSRMVLTREVQRHPVRRDLIHVDFLEVSMTEKIKANVRIIIKGEDVAADLKSGQGVLLREMEVIEIECLPGDLFDSLTIDISQSKIGDVVLVKDLIIPANVTVLENPDDDILRIQRFVEAKVEESTGETAEVEVIEKGKKDEEEGA
jgi:large subunit ribosomal protein L25